MSDSFDDLCLGLQLFLPQCVSPLYFRSVKCELQGWQNELQKLSFSKDVIHIPHLQAQLLSSSSSQLRDELLWFLSSLGGFSAEAPGGLKDFCYSASKQGLNLLCWETGILVSSLRLYSITVGFICKLAVCHCSWRGIAATIIYLKVPLCYLAHGSDVVCLIDQGMSHE